ncbi:glycoside hydrolase family 26 protein [Bythopirellula goksoeyrii]|uniref:Mannan endo-1,4-beta-mannosidase n=1 Tax=Bythopirellula goksoeyrii TaxID=1400387 RepID=A0A5B9Q4K8_9BACT|nr:glycosyl hydrolase [Bythopirellula goksoeyrii]QEG33907.1 Mannan endo-1,4-beta-mannosidase [Bythopirellula goksoeyrii]
MPRFSINRQFMVPRILQTTSLAFALAFIAVKTTTTHAQVSNVLSSSHSAGITPSPQAQNVYDLLTQLENNSRNGIKQTIMGQHVQAHKETYVGQYYDRVGQITNGKLPGFLELDIGSGNYSSSYSAPYLYQGMTLATNAWESGDSIIGYSFHMSVPGSPRKAFEYVFPKPEHDDAWFARTIDKTGNTPEYQLLMQDLSFAADRLETFKNNDIPIVFRPYHEMNKLVHPFWWGNRDPDDFKALWNLTHEYLVEERGLDNLLFSWSTYGWDGTYGGSPWEYYPGDDKVDIVGVDIYEGNPYFPSEFYNDMEYLDKPRIVSETNKMPARWGDSVFPQSVSEIDARPYAIWTIWGSLLELNLDESTPNQWNVSSNNKAIRDTYNYFSNQDGIWRVLSGGPNGSYDFSYLADPPATNPDFNADGLVDGSDFLEWQRGYGTLYDNTHLEAWQSAYAGGTTLLTASSIEIPEPLSEIMILLGMTIALAHSGRINRETYCST